jgi:hypothetical protein
VSNILHKFGLRDTSKLRQTLAVWDFSTWID